ncbi:MAG: ankyrin repeat domain-containing protein [Candidatus Babeliaceae bacterium]|jgi:ankyrin repeat protein
MKIIKTSTILAVFLPLVIHSMTLEKEAIYAALRTDNVQKFIEVLDAHKSPENCDYALRKTIDIIEHLKNRDTFVKEIFLRGANPTYIMSETNSCRPDSHILSSYVMRVKDYPNILELFLQHKTDINTQDPNTGNTCLMFAAKWKYNDLGKKLLKYKANTALKNNRNQTALAIAQENKNEQLADLIAKHEQMSHNQE